ncbi:MAG: UDP-N-acetylmuramoyl-tripeptide--D-alanyl-D-alanine ligase [Candidatus Tantalella remota]|nr:UDP-N-acetylmuramoyl-tripeptide--D-alanyl-D-alanine ligase [Candidatus Tantalella remota]
MEKLTVREIAEITGGQIFSKDIDMTVCGFSTDSRTIKPGEFFIALEGRNYRGHDFIRDAAERGASGIIADRPANEACRASVNHVIRVEDTTEAMARIAAELRKRSGIPVICITGTNGKTTVKEMLAHILLSRYKVLKSRKSYNNIIGVSLTFFELESFHEVVVMEVGTNHPGEIAKLAETASPNMAVITNIGDGHLKFFGDREGVFLEKVSLLKALPGTGLAFLNRDDPFLKRASVRGVARRYFGAESGSDYRINDVTKFGGGYEFTLNEKRYLLPLDGVHNVHNAVAAIAVAENFGLEYEEIRKALETVTLSEGRLERVESEGVWFINDAYNANPDSFESALSMLQTTPSEGKKVVVAGDMLELGSKSDEFHRMIGRSIAGKGIDLLVAMGAKARYIAYGAIESGMGKDRALCVQSHEDAAEIVRDLAGRGALVLLKGSRGTRMEEVLKCFTMSCTR